MDFKNKTTMGVQGGNVDESRWTMMMMATRRREERRIKQERLHLLAGGGYQG
jgi:hypothetical protein